MRRTPEGALLTEARTRADLSQRDLARRAGVPPTTVIRIENGDVEPTTRILRLLLRAAGQKLELTANEANIPSLASLADAWHARPDGTSEPDWTRLRAYLDFLNLHPELRGPSTLRRPESTGSELMDNLLAGIAEKISADAGHQAPAWTRSIKPMRDDWVPRGTPRMIERERATTPVQFSRRRIWLGVDNLWRTRRSTRD